MSSNRGGRGGRGDRGGAPRGRGRAQGSTPSGSRGASPARGGPGGSRGASRGRDFQGGGGASPLPPPGGPSTPFVLGPATLDARFDSAEVGALTSRLSSLRITDPSEILPPRPGLGKNGRAIVLRANHFAVSSFPALIYEYPVQITPSNTPAGIRRRLFKLLQTTPEFAEFARYSASDGAQRIVSTKDFQIPEGQTLDIKIRFFEDDETGPTNNSRAFELSISPGVAHDTSPLRRSLDADSELRDFDTGPLVSMVQLLVSKRANQDGVRLGKAQTKYFISTVRQTRLDDLLFAWSGFALSVRPTHKQLSVNINLATSAFHVEANLVDALMAFDRRSFGADPTPFFARVKVKLQHSGHRKAIGGISRRSPNQYKFKMDDNGRQKDTTVTEFFRKTHNITLRHADTRFLASFGQKKPIMIPPELCKILPNQPFSGKLTPDQTRKMLDVACLAPLKSQETIMRSGLPELGIAPLSETLRDIGINITDKMTTLPGRILPPRSLEYRGQKKVQPRDGGWNVMGSKFTISGRKLEHCGVLLLLDEMPSRYPTNYSGKSDPDLIKALKAFGEVCSKYGLDAKDTAWHPAAITLKNEDRTREIAMSEIVALMRRAPFQIVLVIMPRQDDIYPLLKRHMDTVMDMHCVCSLFSKFKDCKDQYFANLTLKFNAKLGGVNHIVTGNLVDKLRKKGAMFVGADVTHSGPGSLEGTPSIVGVVASNDQTFSRYPVSLRLQPKPEDRQVREMIDELQAMFTERLKAYEKANGQGKFPASIIFVRDGVSEGQFMTVATHELPQIRKACESVAKNYKPKITLLIVGKRHHTRFYTTNADDADQKNSYNTKAGTVVDQGVVTVYQHDFFLQAHAALKGTARPAHYTVLLDENRFTADEIQELMYDLSYVMARATRGVSYAAPAYYADLACEHARAYIQGLYTGDTGSTTSGSNWKDPQAVFERAKTQWGNGPGPKVSNTMFYL